VLFFGEDGVVGFEGVFVEEGLVSVNGELPHYQYFCVSETAIVGGDTYATPWMSSSGFSRHRSSKLPVVAMV
jgi:hypothetical protein